MAKKISLPSPSKRTLQLSICACSFILLFLLVKINIPKEKTLPKEKTFTTYLSANEEEHSLAVQQQIDLLDSEPLFLPTTKNTASIDPIAQSSLSKNRLELFQPYPSQHNYLDSKILKILKIQEPNIEAPLDSLKETHNDFLDEFAKNTVPGSISPLPERPAILQALNLNTYELALEHIAQIPPQTQLWQPAEFLLLIPEEGPIGAPYPLVSSGKEDVDQIIQSYLKTPKLFASLKPGYYQITISP